MQAQVCKSVLSYEQKKKHPNETIEEQQRRSRKEVLVARKEAQQKRQIWIAAGIVGAIILAVILLALINELLISPNRTVASVGDDTIALNEFQDRVVFERTQRIVLLENQLEAFNGDVGIIQQFASQLIIDLLPSSSDTFGESILEQMVDETLLEQAAAERGLSVSEEEVDEAIGADFNYFGGGLPTPAPSATETIVPTPSLTPIPTAVITGSCPPPPELPTPTQGPTATPFPPPRRFPKKPSRRNFQSSLLIIKPLGSLKPNTGRASACVCCGIN
ncbi:MAG: SurA N-terminal domain-containing protein [Chloroflexi bacterium]|nr:SurA N-terminal domain-containing protein [Chloroflexota bacterium]